MTSEQDAERVVLQSLERAARAIRRGERPELVSPALKWEQFLSSEIGRLEQFVGTVAGKEEGAAA